ncbi:ferredoxin [Nocardioides pacificus]
MTQVKVDRNLCSGHARCHATAPAVYDLDELGYVAVFDPEVAPGQVEEARRGAAACPERALQLTD